MRAIALLLVVVALDAIAAAGPAPATSAEIEARINALIRQRSSALNEAAVLSASLELAQRRIEELELKGCGGRKK